MPSPSEWRMTGYVSVHYSHFASAISISYLGSPVQSSSSCPGLSTSGSFSSSSSLSQSSPQTASSSSSGLRRLGRIHLRWDSLCNHRYSKLSCLKVCSNLLCHGCMVSWFHGVRVSWLHGVMVSWFNYISWHDVQMSWCNIISFTWDNFHRFN